MTQDRDTRRLRALVPFVAALAAALLALAPQAVRAADECDPKDDLVAFPYVERLAPCPSGCATSWGTARPSTGCSRGASSSAR